MSLQRRLLFFLLICAPIVWSVAAMVSVDRARHEIDELFDTEIIRLARQVQSTVTGMSSPSLALPPPVGPSGKADLRDLAIAVWDREGRLLLVDREGAQLPHRTDAEGFVDAGISGHPWRVYYLRSPDGARLVAAGQRIEEREELVVGLLGSQLTPWLMVLPLLMLAMAWAVKRAMAPVHSLTAELQARRAEDLQPVATRQAPRELQPLLSAMNGLFGRIASALERERRFTADAAHELRTPLAVLRAQWDLLRLAPDEATRREAERSLGRGLDRLDRLVEQMLALSRLDATDRVPEPAPIAWMPIVQQVMGDVLSLADRRRIELDLDGEPDAFALRGDAALMTILLRNLMDNAVRYAPEDSTVVVRFGVGSLSVENRGPAFSQASLARLGERFWRLDGQLENGSGLGVSIVKRIAALHGLTVHVTTREDGQGVVVTVASAPAASTASAA